MEVNMQLVNFEEFSFTGTHVFGELYGVSYENLDSIDQLEEILTRGIEESKAKCLGIMTKKFKPNGVTLLALLSESHVSVHTYPEHNALFIDAFTCGTLCDPRVIINTFIQKLHPEKNVISETQRGLQNHEIGLPNILPNSIYD
ncbi:adenosylmethionine decarboxylase [Acetobacterium malicum]|uniref:adenosylmethionine decarboxylase n=1 Tax=Acetobacterium malicum TaxID=52692 RepID=UPI0006861556|nr:adenosylmethionine decarboxylase [Acetobacterium dehalogenans]